MGDSNSNNIRRKFTYVDGTPGGKSIHSPAPGGSFRSPRVGDLSNIRALPSISVSSRRVVSKDSEDVTKSPTVTPKVTLEKVSRNNRTGRGKNKDDKIKEEILSIQFK